ncbi:MAG: ABC transporter ATP-binding protein [Cyanobacteria bacterium J06639_16]
MTIGRPLRLTFQQILRFLPALKFVWQSGPGWTLARIILVALQSTLPLISLYLTKLVVDSVVAGLTTPEKTTVFRQAGTLLGFAGAVMLLLTLCVSLSELVNTAQSQRVTDHMQGILQAKAVGADFESYEDPQDHDTLQRAQQEAAYRPNQILNRWVQATQDGISLLAITGLLIALYWWFAAVLFLAALPVLLIRLKYARVMYRWQCKRTPVERRAAYFSWLLTSDLSAKEIRLFDLGGLFRHRFRRLRQQIYTEKLSLATRRSIASLGAQFMTGAAMFGAYAFMLYQAIQGSFTLGDLALYHQAFQRGRSSLQGFVTSLSGLYEDNLFLINLYEFLNLQPRIVDPAIPQQLPQPMQVGIVFNQVGFQYPATTCTALKDISLTIRPGEVVAFVGENGCGKTTLIKLLCRLYDPTTGSIAFDGIDLRLFEIEALRRSISVIFQDYMKYPFTAQENVWFGNAELSPTDDKISKAAFHSGADDLIKSLPQGYNTVLGKRFDQGEELSIGQWQKIALARVFLRDSQVIVLDEPTSAMDPKAEYEVFKRLRQLIKGQTAILISQRLSTVKMADRIYVMAKGSIVETGSHEELMQHGGTYAHLFETQAKSYR